MQEKMTICFHAAVLHFTFTLNALFMVTDEEIQFNYSLRKMSSHMWDSIQCAPVFDLVIPHELMECVLFLFFFEM